MYMPTTILLVAIWTEATTIAMIIIFIINYTGCVCIICKKEAIYTPVWVHNASVHNGQPIVHYVECLYLLPLIHYAHCKIGAWVMLI